MDISKARPIESQPDSQPILQIPSLRDPSADDRLEPSPRKYNAAKEKKERKNIKIIRRPSPSPKPTRSRLFRRLLVRSEDDGAFLLASQNDFSAKQKSSIHNTKSALVAPSSLPETTLKEGGSQDYGPMGSDDDDDIEARVSMTKMRNMMTRRKKAKKRWMRLNNRRSPQNPKTPE